MKRLLATLGILLVAGVAALMAWKALGTTERPVPRNTATEPRAPAAPEAPTLAGTTPEPPIPEPPEPDPKPPLETPEAPPTRVHRLNLTIHGLDPADEEPTSVSVVGFLDPPFVRTSEIVEGTADRGGRATLDVSTLFTGEQRPPQLEIRVDHPHCVPAVVVADVPPAPVEPGDEEHRAEVTLVLAGLVTGRVEDERADPVRQAIVTMHLLGPDGPESGSVSTSLTGEDGAYSVRLGHAGTYLVVAQADGFRPACQEITLAPRSYVTLAPLVLRAGAMISGTLRRRGKPVRGGHLEIRAEGGGTDAPNGRWLEPEIGHALRWSAGRVERTAASADTGDDGRFSAAGLVPGDYGISFSGATDLRLVGWQWATWGNVRAPATDVDLDLGGTDLIVEVVADGRPVTGASVTIGVGGGGSTFHDVDGGRLHCVVGPGLKYTVKVEHPGFEPQTIEGAAGRNAGERVLRIELAPRRVRPTLVLALKTEEGKPLRRTGVQVRSHAMDASTSMPGVHDLTSEDGVFRLAGLEPGPTTVIVLPDRGLQSTVGYYLVLRRQVDLPPEGEVRLDLVAVEGGRIRIAARDEAGNILGADCTIRDSQGTEIDVMFHTSKRTAYGETLRIDGPPLQPGMVSTVDRPLPAGSYRVELSANGRATVTVRVTVEKGKTAVVDTLLPRR